MTENNESLLSAQPEVEAIETTDTTVSNTEQPVVNETKNEVTFINSLPEDLRSDLSLQKFNSNGDLAKSYVELSAKLGSRIEDLSADDIAKLNPKFGIPEDAKGYGIEDLENAGDVEKITNFLKEAGVSKQAGAKIYENLKKIMAEENGQKEKDSFEDRQRKQDETVLALKEKYGIDFDKRISLANKAMRNEPNGAEIQAKLEAAGLGSDIDIIQMFVRRGEALLEDKILGEEVGSFGTTPSQAADQLSDIMDNKEKYAIFRDPSHPDHANIQAKFLELSKIQARLK